MSINNFEIIENFIDFEKDSYYKFEALIRNTDGENPLYYEGSSNINKNILIKSWYVDSREYYERIKNEMKVLCDLTGARLYITLDRKSTKATIINLFKHFSEKIENMLYGSCYGIKSISKEFASCTSIKESSEHDRRTLMWDVDTKDKDILKIIREYIYSKTHNYPFVLNTKKGYHVFCYKKFNNDNWLDWCVQYRFNHIDFESAVAEKDYMSSFKSRLQELVSVKDNELGLIYHPMKGE